MNKREIEIVQLKMLKNCLLLAKEEQVKKEQSFVKSREAQKVLVLTKKFRGKSLKVA